MAKTAPRIRTLFGRDRLRRLRFALKRLEFPSSASKENDALPFFHCRKKDAFVPGSLRILDRSCAFMRADLETCKLDRSPEREVET